MLRPIIYAIAILVCFDLHAQLMPFKNYGIKDGLNDNNVQALITDDRGLLWIGSDFCLYWFDGKKFYQPQINTNIGQLYINSFYKDNNGDIWVLTFFNGLYKFHDGQFTNYLLDTLLKDAITNSISSIAQVSPDKYVVISQGKTYLFDGKKFSEFDPSNKVLNRSSNSVTQLSDHIILLSTDQGVFQYSYDDGKFVLKDHILNGIAAYKMLVTPTRILITTRDGLLSFPKSTPVSSASPYRKYLTGKPIRDIAADPSDKIWILSDSVFKIENEQVTKYSEENGLPENVGSIYCDKQGLVWFADHRGISMLGDEYYQFSSIRDGNNYAGVSSLNMDNKHELWIGTGSGVVIEKDSSNTFKRLDGSSQIGNVAYIHKKGDGTFLMTTDNGVYSAAADGSIKKVVDIKASKICEDNEKRLWFGDIEGHVWVSKNGSLQLLKLDHYACEMITCLYAQDRNLWVGYRGLGVRKYRLQNDSLLLIKEYGPIEGYTDMRIRSCAADIRGNIIWGTRTNGIFIFSIDADTLIAHITVQNGLNGNWIKDIKCDADGKLYLATNNGINILSGDYKRPAISLLRISNENLNREANCILKAGNVFYVGTNEGVLKWMPDNMHKDTVAPPIYFTKISIQGVKNFPVTPYTSNAGEIKLPYDQHVVSFEFAGISLKDPENVKYHYILEGEKNSEWSPVTEYNYVTYNLRPGDYTFEVSAENGDGVWSRTPAVFHFVINPPFWNTWWFIIIVTVVIVLVTYGAYRYKLKQALAVELLRNNISTGLHDDIGSTLSSISILSNMALTESSNTQMLEMIKGIQENSTSLLEKMDDIVWSINPNNDTLDNLIVRFRRFAAVLLEAKNIEYTIDVAPAIKKLKISMSYRQHVYLILKETINNLIKYSNCTRVYIGVLYENGCLEITVQDNGIGFDAEKVVYGNGIINMKQRAKYMNAAIKIETMPGMGTKINMKVKIR